MMFFSNEEMKTCICFSVGIYSNFVCHHHQNWKQLGSLGKYSFKSSNSCVKLTQEPSFNQENM